MRLRLSQFLLACLAPQFAWLGAQDPPPAREAMTDRGLQVIVRDRSGAVVPGASIRVRTPAGRLIVVLPADETGRRKFPGLRDGPYDLEVTAPGFATERLKVDPGGATAGPIVVELRPAGIRTQITVTAARAAEQEVRSAAAMVTVRDRTDIKSLPLATLGNVLAGSPGVLVQQSTYGQASPFLRGMTGYHVLNLIDGIRFNNCTFRSGPNQYLAFIEPSQAERVEAVLGPSGAQYGSDSMGGTINVLTPRAAYGSAPGVRTRGELRFYGASADASLGVNGRAVFAAPRWSWLVGGAGRKLNDLRAGGGTDSRNVYRRYFGLTDAELRGLVGSRQQDTGFSERGVHTKFAARLAQGQDLTLWYQHSTLAGVRGYKDLLGGRGHLRSEFTPQALNFFYGRYEKRGAGFLDAVTGTFSFNSQQDGSVRQSLQFSDPVTTDFNRVDAYGYSAEAISNIGSRQVVVFGGELFDERVRSSRLVYDPVTHTRARRRPLYPDGSVYRTFALFGQDSVEIIPGRLRAVIGGRLTGVDFETPAKGSQPGMGGGAGVVDASQRFRDVTFKAALSWQATRFAALHFRTGRGFRAPNLNDLGAIGLNDLGFEVPASEVEALGALIGSSSGDGALSTGKRVTGLVAESLYNYEFGVTVHGRRLQARVQAFDAELYDPIVRRTLLFPAAAAPETIAHMAVMPVAPTQAQREQGVVPVATELDPRAVKAFVNDGRSRYYGIESLAEYRFRPGWSVHANYSFLAGRVLNPNRNVRRLPPQHGSLTLRHLPGRRGIWWELAAAAAGSQKRLSGGDLADERIGAARSRNDIAGFFGGAVVSPFIDRTTPLPVFVPTGETLPELQNRVLPLGATVNGVIVRDDNTRVPLYLKTAGWLSLSLRGGVPVGERVSLNFAAENLLDRNYRYHGSGVDNPGISLYLSLRYSF